MLVSAPLHRGHMDTSGIELPSRRTRRRHAPEFRGQVVQACRQPGVSIAAVALANGLNANMLRKWVIDAETRPARAPTADLGGPAQVRALAVRLAAAGGRRLGDAEPLVDARLPDGTRLHAVLPPIAVDGPLLSLRVLRRAAFPLDALVASGSVAPLVARTLVGLVLRRANLLISGATGTGKTTLLAALLALVPPEQRVVCLEESGELDPDHPHVVRLVSRRPNVEGAGQVDLTRLVRESLRMRPDRIVLGECRGAEVREVLGALTTGHEGSWATVHANAAQDVPARLEAMGALAGMSPAAVAAQAGAALDAVVHVRRDGGRRRVAQLGAVRREGAGLRVEEVLAVDETGTLRAGRGWPEFARRWEAGDGTRFPAAGAPGGVGATA